MDMKKIVVPAAIALLLVAVLIVVFAFNGSEQTEAVAPTAEPVEVTQEVQKMGVEESFFDEEAEEEEEKKPEATEAPELEQPKETEPPKPEITNPEPSDSGLVDQQPDDTQVDRPAPTEVIKPQPTEPVPSKPAEPEPTAKVMDYETFQNLSPAEQQAFIDSFPSIEDFFAWFNAAKKAYEQANPSIAGGGTIDMGAIIAGKK